MEINIVKFSLIKENAAFSDKQKEMIELFIKTYNWGSFNGFTSIDFLDIGDNYFIVKVDIIDNTWYGVFSRLLCDNALLHDYRIIVHNNYRLFEQQTQQIV